MVNNMGIFSKKIIGDKGEIVAAKFLKKNKYKIIKTNYKNKLGEIDIICEDKKYIVFVEVKTRKIDSIVTCVLAVNNKKQYHILRTAHKYLSENESNKQPRFDIIEVEYYNDGTYNVIEHYINAFMQGGSYAVF